VVAGGGLEAGHEFLLADREHARGQKKAAGIAGKSEEIEREKREQRGGTGVQWDRRKTRQAGKPRSEKRRPLCSSRAWWRLTAGRTGAGRY